MGFKDLQTVSDLIQFTEMLQDHFGKDHLLAKQIDKTLSDARKIIK